MTFIPKIAVRTAARVSMVLGVGMLAPSWGIAQVPPDADWQFRATIYGYLPTLSGATRFPAAGSDIEVSPNQLISNLKFTFMGAFEAQKGSWGAFTDVMYLNVGGSKSGTRDLVVGGVQLPVGVTANASLDIKSWVWTLAANYRALSTPEGNLDVFAGTRLLDLKEGLNWQFSADVGPFVGPGRQGSSEANLTHWDGIVGVKGRRNFGAESRWFVPWYLDIGTGDSHLTWQAIAGVGYAFNWGELIAAWRYLDYDFKSGKAIESLKLNGAAIGVTFRW